MTRSARRPASVAASAADAAADPAADAPAAALSAELEAALLRELHGCYGWANAMRFGDRMKAPVIRLADTATRLGAWMAKTRTIELARALVLDRPWFEVVAVLEHEMAHQFVDEVLGIRDETAHGETFRKVCAERGIDGRAAGAPVAGATTVEVDRVLDRVRKLLALAGSSNQHEAEVAMQRAHQLMLRHNIEAAAARTAAAYEIRHVGDAEKRSNLVEAQVVGLLAEFFFVKAIRVPVYLPRLGKRGALFELTGSRANVEMAVHVHAFLLATADRLWHANRADARVHSGRDRMSYQAGVILGFRDKLQDERAVLTGTGLIWVGDAHLDGFYHARHPRITRRTRKVRLAEAHEAGREAGRSIVLHRPLEQAATSGGRKLLGS